MGKDKSLKSFVEDLALGGISAAVSKTAVAPIERVKLLLQNQKELLNAGKMDASEAYKGIGDCFAKVRATEGVAAFWRGNAANVLRYFPTQALNFAFKDQYKAMIMKPKEEVSKIEFAMRNVASGSAAGGSSLFFVYSLDFARTRLATDVKSAKGGGKREFNGLADCLKKIYAKDGIRGLYQGFGISLVGIVVYRGTYFGGYDTIRDLMWEDPSKANPFSKWVVGVGVTTVAGILSYPLDTIRRRMMQQSGGVKVYSSAFDAAVKIAKAEGAGAFFGGVAANVLRGFGGAAVLVLYDEMKAMLAANK